jgi:RNA polymerase sigma factor (sigma-70 family)
MDDDTDPLPALVVAAATGHEDAWNAIVDRFSPLLASVLRQYRLTRAEAEDVAQTVWLRLVEHLGELREPRALPQWLITTGRREVSRFVCVERRAAARDLPNEDRMPPAALGPQPDEDVLRVERHQALLSALAELEPRQRDLLMLLIEDPPPSYAEIHRRTGIPVGSIGPTRARAIARLQRSAPIRAVASTEPCRPGPAAEARR